MSATKQDSPFPEEFLEAMRNRMFAMRGRVAAECRDLGELTLEPAGRDASVEQPAETGSEEFADEVNLSLLVQESDLLRELEEAILRIDGGGPHPYGLCEDCQTRPRNLCPTCPWIPEDRLRESPWVRNCAQAQARIEAGTQST